MSEKLIFKRGEHNWICDNEYYLNWDEAALLGIDPPSKYKYITINVHNTKKSANTFFLNIWPNRIRNLTFPIEHFYASNRKEWGEKNLLLHHPLGKFLFNNFGNRMWLEISYGRK